MTSEQAKELIQKHGSVRKASEASGVGRKTLTRLSKAESSGRRVGKSLLEFRSQYDKDFIVPHKVTQALKALGNKWEYEVEFARLAGVGLADLGNYRSKFAEHVVSLRDSRRVWAGTTALAKTLKEMI